ncbi:MAG: FaeA/PapI family transcriptional regulator [Rivularia sp. (in: cyanobacteria)]
MADEQKVFSILREAKKQDLIKPSEISNPCFVSYINTANHILLEIKKSLDGKLGTEEIVTGTGLNKNTCKIYLRSLEKLHFIHRVKDKKSKITVWELN